MGTEEDKLEKFFSSLTDKIDYTGAANKTIQFANYVERIINSAIIALEAFDKEIACKQIALIEAKEILKEVGSAAQKYINAVDNLFHYSEKADFAKIKEEIENNNNYKWLDDFFHKMDYCFKQIGIEYRAFTEKCNEASKMFTACAVSCACEQATARSKQRKTRVVGVTATATWISIAGSIVVGVYTSGIGVVLGVTLSSAAVSISGWTYMVTKDTINAFKKAEDSYKSMSLEFKELTKQGIEIKSQFNECHIMIENYEMNYDLLKQTNQKFKEAQLNTLDRMKQILE